MSIVKGRKMIAYYYDPVLEEDIPFARATSNVFNTPTDLKEITRQTSANWREFKYDIATWSVQTTGFVALEKYSYLFLLNLRTNRTKITIKFAIDNGTDGFVIISGQCLLADLTINGNDNEAGSYSCLFQGTGGFSISGAQPEPGGVVIRGTTSTRLQWKASGGETSHVFSDGIGRTILYASRGTMDFEPIAYVGSPTEPNEAVWDTASGMLTWLNEAFPGENIAIIVQ